MKKIPIQLVVGDGEKENGTVTVRRQGHNESVTLPMDEFVKMLSQEVEEKR